MRHVPKRLTEQFVARMVLLALAATSGIVASFLPVAFAHSRTTAVTYRRDVGPILQRRCIQCHSADGPGHLPLETFEEARSWSRAIQEQVLERRMPPWPAATGFADYGNDRSLTPIEIELLAAWADGGTPLGDGAEVVPEVKTRPTAALVLTLPAAPPRSRVERFSLETNERADRWISGWDVRLNSPAVVQQVIASIGTAPLGSWVPGEDRIEFPRGVSQRLRRGATIDVEVRYTKGAAAERPGGRVVLYADRPGLPLERMALGCSPTRMTHDLDGVAVTPMAPADESVEIVARRPDETVEPLCVVLRSQPSYPASYRFKRPVWLPRGTILDVHSSSPDCSATLEFTSRKPGRGVVP